MSRRHLLLLGAAVTDVTFEKMLDGRDGKVMWVGKCIHCNTKLAVADDGRSLGEATLEHVWPQTQGGTNELSNLAVACSRCNREKGTRHDHTRTQRLEEIVAELQAKRMARWRDPDAVNMAGRLARLTEPAAD